MYLNYNERFQYAGGHLQEMTRALKKNPISNFGVVLEMAGKRAKAFVSDWTLDKRVLWSVLIGAWVWAGDRLWKTRSTQS